MARVVPPEGLFLREWRIAKDWILGDLADRARISPAQLSGFETGRSKLSRRELIQVIAVMYPDGVIARNQRDAFLFGESRTTFGWLLWEWRRETDTYPAFMAAGSGLTDAELSSIEHGEMPVDPQTVRLLIAFMFEDGPTAHHLRKEAK
ncbi:MAG: helix-turn-helix transcriptional regulator [Pseudomonadota bacterium]